jgi:hypothetical protein
MLGSNRPHSRLIFLLTLLLTITLLPLSSLTIIRAAQTPGFSMAALFPDSTAIYGEMRTRDLLNLARTHKATSPLWTHGVAQELIADIGASLTAQLEREATFEGDVLSWLGDRAAFGVMYPDDDMVSEGVNSLLGVIVIEASNSAKARELVMEFMRVNNARAGTEFTLTRGRMDTEALYSLYTSDNGGFLMWRNYIALGSNDALNLMISTGNGERATLADDAEYIAMRDTMDGDTMGYIYADSLRLVRLAFASLEAGTLDTSDATQLGLVLSLPSLLSSAASSAIIAFRAQGEDVLAIDVRWRTDESKPLNILTRGVSPLNPTNYELQPYIPSNALAVIQAGDFGGLLNLLLRAAETYVEQNPANSQLRRALDQIKVGLRTLGIDIEELYTTARNDYAAYMVIDRRVALSGTEGYPFAHVFFTVMTPYEKARAFTDEFAQTLRLLNTDEAVEIVQIAPYQYGIARRVEAINSIALDPIQFGSVGAMVYFTVNGQPSEFTSPQINSLESNPTYQRARTLMQQPQHGMFFVNLRELSALENERFAPSRESWTRDHRVNLDFLNLSDSAVIYGHTLPEPGGVFVHTITFAWLAR